VPRDGQQEPRRVGSLALLRTNVSFRRLSAARTVSHFGNALSSYKRRWSRSLRLWLPALPILLLLVGVRAAVAQVFQPASRAAVPMLVRADGLRSRIVRAIVLGYFGVVAFTGIDDVALGLPGHRYAALPSATAAAEQPAQQVAHPAALPTSATEQTTEQILQRALLAGGRRCCCGAAAPTELFGEV
jgi:hypothetical protein